MLYPIKLSHLIYIILFLVDVDLLTLFPNPNFLYKLRWFLKLPSYYIHLLFRVFSLSALILNYVPPFVPFLLLSCFCLPHLFPLPTCSSKKSISSISFFIIEITEKHLNCPFISWNSLHFIIFLISRFFSIYIFHTVTWLSSFTSNILLHGPLAFLLCCFHCCFIYSFSILNFKIYFFICFMLSSLTLDLFFIILCVILDSNFKLYFTPSTFHSPH